jgi:hypothetical protein
MTVVSSPCQRQCELLPSLTERVPTYVQTLFEYCNNRTA